MNNNAIPYRFLAVEGNIGAGKTTLCRMLSDDLDYRLILEEFTDNPFLPPFYENPERYAFPVELFFMTERHKQLQEELSQQNIFQQNVISDYFFYKTLLFAQKNLNRDEYRLFQRLFRVLNASFPKPELLLYLHRPVKDLITNIQKRGRSYEQDISSAYLEKIQRAYFEYFRTEVRLPILVIDVEGINFQSTPKYYEQILHLLKKNYPVGVHHVKIQ